MADRVFQSDAIMAEIVRNGLLAVVEDMKTNLMRTAYSRVIYEGLDFTVGLFDAQGDAVAIALGLPMFVRGMAETVKAMLAHYGLDGMEPGDILVTNDADVTGSHLHHITMTLPIYAEGRIVAFACCMAHWHDIGGVLDGVTTDIFSEGLQVPILKAYRGGQVNRDLLEIIRLNVREPEHALGDWRAQVTAVKTGESRFLELVGRYGTATVLTAIGQILDHSERLARANTRSIPDGVYEAESFLDDDGIRSGVPVPIHVRVEVDGDRMVIDLSQVSPQVAGFYNSGPSTGRGCAELAYKCLTSPNHYPINDGSFRPLQVILPPGKVVSARRPAPMRWWMTYPMTIADTVIRALAPAVPDRVIAGHHADLNLTMLNWLQNGRRRTSYVGANGGWGAAHHADGMSSTICINDGDTHRSPVEQIESKNPLLFESCEFIPDSGGAGRQRGGLGTRQEVRVLCDQTLNIQIERHCCPPWGLEGGQPGSSNTIALREDGVLRDDFPTAKLLGHTLASGDAFIVLSGGGGGFGLPWKRALEAIRNDLRQGYITPHAAETLYGVVFDTSTGEIDEAATRLRRAAMQERSAA
jgi:N-methylhydantoinase B